MKLRYTLLVSLGACIGLMSLVLVRKPDYWGFFGHRRINHLAVFTLVPEMMPVFKKHIEFITEHAVDPDKRRYAVSGEAARHFIDLDVWRQMGLNNIPINNLTASVLFGNWIDHSTENKTKSLFNSSRLEIIKGKKYLKLNLPDTPRIDFFQYQQFLAIQFKSGNEQDDELLISSDSFNVYFNQSYLSTGKTLYWQDTFSKHGILPFFIPQHYNKLVHAFKAKNLPAILRFAADLGHYLGDAHVPLHTTSNYNGQLTGQTGLHAFWESRIPELFADQSYDYLVGKASYIKDIQSYSWDIVLDSHRYVDSVLLIEKRLSMQFSKDQQYCFTERNSMIVKLQCEAYAQAYQEAMKGMVEKRMRAAILSVGSVWYSAWIDAGQPNLKGITESDAGTSFDSTQTSIQTKNSIRPEN